MENILLRKATENDIEKILHYIEKYNLDEENISYQQFIVAEINGNLIGFGRIKPYNSLYELGSIGVIKEYRKQGVGKSIVNHLISIFPTNEIWLTTKKPDYFRKFGFSEAQNPPYELTQKAQRVCSSICRSTEGIYFMVLKKSE